MRAVSALRYLTAFAAMVGVSLLCPTPTCAARQPEWVERRPSDAQNYVGVGTAERKGRKKAEYRKAATDRALSDLASQIEVRIASTFVQTLVEQTGMSEEEIIRSEIVASTQARLTNCKLVDSWKGKDDYWVFYRLSKAEYARQRARRRADAIRAGVDMLRRAEDARERDTAAALSLYFSALAAIQHFVGEGIETEHRGNQVILFNEIYSGLQTLLSDISLQPSRQKAFFRPGGRPQDQLSVCAEAKVAGRLARCPIRFELADDAELMTQVVTDKDGNAFCGITKLGDAPAYNLRARLDVEKLYEGEAVLPVFEKLVARLPVPETSILLTACSDEEDCLWRSAFAGESVALLCAYEANGVVKPWTKMQDEMRTVLQNKGATVVDLTTDADLANGAKWSASPQTRPAVGEGTKLVVMVASGKLNRRDDPQNPFGDTCQFVGEIRTLTSDGGPSVFADRYRGAGGWNPMGEDMCMDVMALHVLKRWKPKFLQHLGEQDE